MEHRGLRWWVSASWAAWKEQIFFSDNPDKGQDIIWWEKEGGVGMGSGSLGRPA